MNFKKCPNCDGENPETEAYCLECGAKLEPEKAVGRAPSQVAGALGSAEPTAPPPAQSATPWEPIPRSGGGVSPVQPQPGEPDSPVTRDFPAGAPAASPPAEPGPLPPPEPEASGPSPSPGSPAALPPAEATAPQPKPASTGVQSGISGPRPGLETAKPVTPRPPMPPARPEAAVSSGKKTRVIPVALAAAGILAGAVVAWRLLSHRETRVTQPAVSDKVIVELRPFVETAGSVGHDHIGQGLAETLADNLNRLPRLRLICAPPAAAGPTAAGHASGAQFALSGTFTAGGDRLLVTARLVKAAGGAPVREIEVSRPAGDVFGALREVAAGLVQALDIAPPAGGWETLFPDRASVPDAVDAHFRGRSLAAQGGRANLEKAVEFLEQSVRRDPSWAGAHAALANAYISLGSDSLWAPAKAFPAAKKSADEALRLEPGLGEARLASARLKWRSDWDYAAAEKEYREAVRVAPEQAEIRRSFGLFLSSLGRHEEAQAEIRAALEIEPGASRAASSLGLVLYYARLYDQAGIELENARQARPADSEPCLGLGLLHLQTREFGESLGMFQQAVLRGGDPLELGLRAGIVLAHLGRRQDVGKLLGEAIQASRRSYVSSASLAAVYAALTEPDQAEACLDKAIEERDASLVFLKVSPLFDPLRGEAWFAGLLRKAGF